MDYYNYRKTHPDSIGKENGYGTPAEAHLSENPQKDLAKELVSDKIKALSTKAGKEVGEKTILTGQVLGDSFIKRRSEKEEVSRFIGICNRILKPGH